MPESRLVNLRMTREQAEALRRACVMRRAAVDARMRDGVYATVPDVAGAPVIHFPYEAATMTSLIDSLGLLLVEHTRRDTP